MLGSLDVISLIPITDGARARVFYEETLGLPFIEDDGFAVVFEVNGRRLRLTKVEELRAQPFSIIGWRTPDIEATVRGLAERGVSFSRYPYLEQDELGIWRVPDGSAKVAWFEDPDGNVLSVVEAPDADA
jgi:catechol 2,3-dioxygenase-like lactoylglutathione lyase family enzyme